MSTPPRLYIFFGLIASGKSTLAEAWAQAIGAPYYNSDRVRKDLAGLVAHAPQPESFQAGIYSTAFSRKTYDALLHHAELDLRANRSVVLDGSYQAKMERLRVDALAREYNAPGIFVLCRCPEELMKERMAQRARDPLAVSDGRWEIYLQQKANFEAPAELPPTALITIDTDAPVATLLTRLRGYTALEA
jgi:hypothetical protein